MMSSELKPDIWRLQARWNVRSLIRALKSDDVIIRKRAAASLLVLGALDAIPYLEEALQNEKDEDAHLHMETALLTLQREREERANSPAEASVYRPIVARIDPETQALIDNLRTGDTQQIIETARIAADRNALPVVETLVIIFNRRETSLKARLAVAEALLQMASAPVEVSLLGALRSDNWQVRRKGAIILGELSAEWAIEPLMRCLSDKNVTVRQAAYHALHKINTPISRRILAIIKDKAVQRQRLKKQISWIDAPTKRPTQPLESK
jgi:HEAT repeat protein